MSQPVSMIRFLLCLGILAAPHGARRLKSRVRSLTRLARLCPRPNHGHKHQKPVFPDHPLQTKRATT